MEIEDMSYDDLEVKIMAMQKRCDENLNDYEAATHLEALCNEKSRRCSQCKEKEGIIIQYQNDVAYFCCVPCAEELNKDATIMDKLKTLNDTLKALNEAITNG